MDANLIRPRGPTRCEVGMDDWIDPAAGAGEAFQEESLAASRVVHDEHVAVSESVQRGVPSRSCERGRDAVASGQAMHLLHRCPGADLAGKPHVAALSPGRIPRPGIPGPPRRGRAESPL